MVSCQVSAKKPLNKPEDLLRVNIKSSCKSSVVHERIIKTFDQYPTTHKHAHSWNDCELTMCKWYRNTTMIAVTLEGKRPCQAGRKSQVTCYSICPVGVFIWDTETSAGASAGQFGIPLTRNGNKVKGMKANGRQGLMWQVCVCLIVCV